MPRYKVELLSVDEKDESEDVSFSTFVVADDKYAALKEAKKNQKTERPEINQARNWFWFMYETSEAQSADNT